MKNQTQKVITTYSGVDVPTRQIEVMAVASKRGIRMPKGYTLVHRVKDNGNYYAVFYKIVGKATIAQKVKYWVRKQLGMHEPITVEKVVTL